MNEWHRILRAVTSRGVYRPDRTGVGTLSVFGEQLAFDNRPGTFPAVTTKRLAFGQVAAELAAFLVGAESKSAFHRHGCRIWDGNIDAWTGARYPGDAGRTYGVQWRRWRSPRDSDLGDGGIGGGGTWAHVDTTDQLRALVFGMLTDPFGRRHLVTAWNPGELAQMCLPPCHVLFQAYVEPQQQPDTSYQHLHVDLRVDMRSVDLFLGLPFDIASYALLQKLLVQQLNRDDSSDLPRMWVPRWLVFQLGDAHVYSNHAQQVATVLAREPRDPPDLRFSGTLLSFAAGDADLVRYDPHPPVNAPLNV